MSGDCRRLPLSQIVIVVVVVILSALVVGPPLSSSSTFPPSLGVCALHELARVDCELNRRHRRRREACATTLRTRSRVGRRRVDRGRTPFRQYDVTSDEPHDSGDFTVRGLPARLDWIKTQDDDHDREDDDDDNDHDLR